MKYLSYQPSKATSYGHSRKATSVAAFDEICERFKRELCAIGEYHDIELTVRFHDEQAAAGVEIIKDIQLLMGEAGEESIYIHGYDPPNASCVWKLKDGKQKDGKQDDRKLRARRQAALELYTKNIGLYDGHLANLEVTEAFSFFFKGLAKYDESIAALNGQERKQIRSRVIMTNGSSRYLQPEFNFPLTDDLGIAKEAITKIQGTGLVKLNPHHFRIIEITKNGKMITRKLADGKLP